MPKRKKSRKIQKNDNKNHHLFKRLAAVIVLSYGLLVILVSKATITGAVIGANQSTPATFFVGFILFILGLVLYPRH